MEAEGKNTAPPAPKSVEEKETEAQKPTADTEVNGESADAADATDTADAADGGSEEPKELVPKDDSKEDEPNDKEPKEQDSEAKKEEPPSKVGADTNTEKGRGRRVRKSTENYTVAEKPRKELEIPNGKGEKLEEMPNVVANFKAITWSNPHLQDLHAIIFGQGKKKEFKGHLLQFNGVVYPEGKGEKEQDKILAKMYKLKMDDLKAVMDLADVDRSAGTGSEKGTGKEALCDRFLEWLENPTASGKERGTKKGKRKSGSAASATKKTTPAKKARKAKATPVKMTSAKKEKSSTKKATPRARKATPNTDKAAAKSTPKSSETNAPTPVLLNIPGVDIEKVREKVKSIVEHADKAELTVKGVRKMLEEWLDTDLTDHKDAIRSIVMEVM